MSTNLPSLTEAPAYIKALLAANPELAKINQEAAAGISAGLPPTIGLKGTRFVVKENSTETVLNTLELHAVVLKGKPNLEKKWYATKYSEGQDTKAPDCYSLDGIKPDPASTIKQCESCAGCPQNVFGTGTDANGNPGKGKACADSKVLAIFANKGVYRFPIPPASLGAFGVYCKQLDAYGQFLPTVITVIGFDPDASFPKLTFTFGGALAEAQVSKIVPLITSPEVKAIVESSPAQIAYTPAAPAEQAEAKPVVDLTEEKKKKDEAAKAKKAAEAKAKKEAEEAAKAAAAQAAPGLDLGLGEGTLDLGLGDASVIEPELVASTEGPSDDEIISNLGL